ncbi:MAG: hypothetical protein DLM69_04885 [Candidatus Chloroheliales bacterium]|nr:MAG: hypothetical protein DLM69_04885 [Chloroflexota bacterium]
MPKRMSRPRIKEVHVPHGSLAARVFSRTDYTEAFRMRLPAAAPHDVESVTRAFCSVRQGWIYALLWLRNRLVSVVHLKPEGEGPRQPITLERGTQAGIFRVYEHSANEILLGEDDRHLDYRVSVLVQQGQRGWYVTVSTVVHFHNLLGRTYFIPVRPLHRLTMRAMMRAMFQR